MHDGTEIAVKVQRPDLALQVGIDFYALRVLLAAANTTFSFADDVAVVQALLDEVGAGIFAELNFEQEGRNIEEFQHLYRRSLPDVVVPDVIWSRTSRRVLTM
eukprot:1371316-Amphidinium_carterae.1